MAHRLSAGEPQPYLSTKKTKKPHKDNICYHSPDEGSIFLRPLTHNYLNYSEVWNLKCFVISVKKP